MFTISTSTFFFVLRILLLLTPTPLAGAVPFFPRQLPPTNSSAHSNSSTDTHTPSHFNSSAPSNPSTFPSSSTCSNSSSYWVSSIKRRGAVAFGNSTFKVYRNVKDYGATGDGKTDDTDAINEAVSDGGRCGMGCDSSTTTPAIVFFPPGTYLVSKPIVQLYYTQFIGDAVTLPTIKAAPSFVGIAVFDSDPYLPGGVSQYMNQNNFLRQIRNFIVDLTAQPITTGTGVHWQVAQATSLQNIRFEMIVGGKGNRQQGIFMDNGSGGLMIDLVFNGGYYGAFLGNQQFTTRNMTFNNVQTAVFMNWNWLWAFKSLSINNCGVGLNMSNGRLDQSVGSVLVQDSKITNTPIGIATSFGPDSRPPTGGTLVIDNVDFTGSETAVANLDGKVTLAGGSKVDSWAQGHAYTIGGGGSSQNGTSHNGSFRTGTSHNPSSAATKSRIQGSLFPLPKPASLLTAAGAVFERSRPQYEGVRCSFFISVKSKGAKGDGITDDTAAIQAIFDAARPGQVVYFDHGAYIISETVRVPKDIKITGEIWPLILASGVAFSDPSKPTPVFQVGQPGDVGCVELSDLIFETQGPQPGAILMEWNVADPVGQKGSSGMWDVHFRIGGTTGTGLQSNTCLKPESGITMADEKCMGAFLLLHVTSQASIYVENSWFWTADHELDLKGYNLVNIYNGRGVLIESQGPVWMYGTASEHHQLYNYQIAHAKDVYMSAIQTETPYFQSNPDALSPFAPAKAFSDPTFSTCSTASCRKSWGLRIVDSSGILVYGAGLYSFFDNYDQTCLATESCQENIVSIEDSSEVQLWGLSTKASTNMVTLDGKGIVDQKDNRNNFCSTIALFAPYKATSEVVQGLRII